MTPTFLTDATPLLISGVTGAGDKWGGKTATANYLGTTLVDRGHYRYMVAFDPKGGNYRGTPVDGPREAADAIGDGETRLDWHPGGWDDLADEHETAMRFVDGLAGDAVVIHDDAVLYATATSLARMTAVSGNPGAGATRAKSIVVSQDPWDLPRRGVRANLPTIIWVGPVTDEAESFLRQTKSGRVAEEVRDRHEGRPFWWTAIDGDDLYTFRPVPEGFA